jgi:glycosyltransferase involved in cell wall biosynthesis
MTVAAIIPALNEEQAIGLVVGGIPRGAVDVIVVVDNGSKDRTAEIARAAGAAVVRQPERGYGAAMIAGVAVVPDAAIYVFLDGDASDVTDGLPEMIRMVRDGEAQLVLGVRAGAVERGSLLWHQRLGNGLVTWIISRISRRSLRDLPSLKVVDGDVYRSLQMRERTHGWTAELISKAAIRRLTIAEIDAGYRRRVGTSKVSGSARGSLLAAYRIVAAVVRVWRTEGRRPTSLTLPAWGALVGAAVAIAVLTTLGVMLMNSGGANFKVLVAVWLWLLPVTGLLAGLGYTAGRIADWIASAGKTP